MKRVIKKEVNDGNRFVVLFSNLINIFLGIIESFLFIRIFLRLFGANAQNLFVDIIYKISDFLVRPFVNIFKNIELNNGNFLEINTFIAMIVYALIVWLIVSVFKNLNNKKVKEEIIDIHHE